MADEKTYTLPEFAQKLSATLRTLLVKHEADIANLRAREQKLSKHDLCPLCSGPDINGICGCFHGLSKGDSDSGLGSMGGGGTEPMAMAEKCATCGKPMKLGKCESCMAKAGTSPHLDEVKPGLAKAMPSSSASALAPKAPVPTTPTAHVNQELGGFQSAIKPSRTPIASMGRAKASASGVIPNAKSEKNPGSAKPFGTGGPGHASQTNMPSALKANMAPVGKSEKDASAKTTVGRGLDDKAVPGSKMPKAGKSVDTKNPGSGGELRKDAEIPNKPKGVGGKQMVGAGGGDAMKPISTPAKAGVGTAPGLPKVGGQRPLASAKDSPALQHFGRGAVDVNLDGARHRPLASATDSPAAQHFGRGAIDVDVSDFAQKPAATAAGRGAPAVQTPGQVHAGVAQGALAARNQAVGNLTADKKAGGVGFLNALVSKFRPPAPAPIPAGPGQATSQRVRGAKPLQRAEGDMGTKIEKCALCKGTEHRGLCKGLSAMNHNRNMLRVKP